MLSRVWAIFAFLSACAILFTCSALAPLETRQLPRHEPTGAEWSDHDLWMMAAEHRTPLRAPRPPLPLVGVASLTARVFCLARRRMGRRSTCGALIRVG